jgi:hypothetical protein
MATDRNVHAPEAGGTARRFEPWPWLVVLLLAAMITSSLGFYWVAATHPDPPVVEDAYRAGLDYAERLRAPAIPEAGPAPDGAGAERE